MWDASFVDVVIVGMSTQHVGCLLTCKTTGVKYGVCFVYGLHSVVARRPIWGHVEELFEAHELPWLVMGDFNCVMNGEERMNGEPVTMYESKDMVDD